jgi:hypothetical protein
MPALIGIGVAIFIIYLYILLMGWLFENVFLDVLIGAALAALTVAPIGYGVGAYRTFRSDEDWHWRDLLWVPIAALLILIYADLVVVLDSAFEGLRHARALPPWLQYQDSGIQDGLHGMFGDYAGLLRLMLHPLLGLDRAVPGEAALWVYALLALVVKIGLVVVLLLAVRGLDSDYQDGAEPAHRQYFFADAYRDMLRLLQSSWNGIAHYYRRGGLVMQGLFASEAAALTWILMIFVWPLAIAAVIGLFVLPALLGALFLPLMFLIHAFALALVGLIFVGVALLLALIERSILFVRSGWAKCPHPGCYKPVALPVYRCPRCGARHRRLLPGRCGVLRRQCICGHLLPTFSWLGKQRLPAECPHCHGELPHALFSSNLVLPIYGGPAAGKTMFKHAGVVRLLEGDQPDLDAGLIVEREENDYQRRLKPAFDRGQLPPKTKDLKPPAYLLSLRRQGGLGRAGRPVSVYLYDPAGETNEQELHLDQQHYLRHLGGLALLVDPLSFPTLKTAFEATGEPLPDGTCRSDPLDLVERVHEALEKHTGLGATKRFQRRLAVVLTKGDIPLVQRELGVTVEGAPSHAAWHGFDRATSERIRAWLLAHEPAFLHALETHFSQLQFFIVSAMGHDARAQRAFEPKRVLEPLLWLLASRGALRRPVLMRWTMTTAEVAIVAVLLAAFSVLPIAGATVVPEMRFGVACILDPGCAREPEAVVAKVAAPPPRGAVAPVPGPEPLRPPARPVASPPQLPLVRAPTAVAPTPAQFAIVRDGISAGLTGSDRPLPFRDSFNATEAPLFYYAQYRHGQAGNRLYVHWYRDGSAVDSSVLTIRQGDGAGYTRSPNPLLPGAYRAIVSLDANVLGVHAFSIAGRSEGAEPGQALREAVVTASSLKVRAGPSTGDAQLFSLAGGTRVSVTGRSTRTAGLQWVPITAADGSGWVAEKYLRYSR